MPNYLHGVIVTNCDGLQPSKVTVFSKAITGLVNVLVTVLVTIVEYATVMPRASIATAAKLLS